MQPLPTPSTDVEVLDHKTQGHCTIRGYGYLACWPLPFKFVDPKEDATNGQICGEGVGSCRPQPSMCQYQVGDHESGFD